MMIIIVSIVTPLSHLHPRLHLCLSGAGVSDDERDLIFHPKHFQMLKLETAKILCMTQMYDFKMYHSQEIVNKIISDYYQELSAKTVDRKFIEKVC